MIDVIIADDHTVLREALCELLKGRGNFNVIGQAGDGSQLLELLKQKRPHVVIMDIAMPKLDGVKTLEELSSKNALPPVLVLTADEGEKNVRAALRAGAKGYMPKHAAMEELVFALNSIVQGKTYLSPSVTAALMTRGPTGRYISAPAQ